MVNYMMVSYRRASWKMSNRWAWLVGVSLMVALHAGAQSLKFEASLIWGTEDPKPEDPKIKKVDPALSKRLKSVFKWPHYFTVNRQKFELAENANKDLKMSRQCRVNVVNLGGREIKVTLFGEGKRVVEKTQTIALGELVVLAGDDKNDTAWFVILKNPDPVQDKKAESDKK